jgi:hypothetical protein
MYFETGYINVTPPKFDLVIQDCDAALALDPKYIKALNRRATALEGLLRWEEALRGTSIPVGCTLHFGVCLPLDTPRSSIISAFSLFSIRIRTNTTIIRRLYSCNYSRPVPKSDHSKCGGEGVEGAVSAKGKGPTECKFLFKIFSILCLMNTNMVF